MTAQTLHPSEVWSGKVCRRREETGGEKGGEGMKKRGSRGKTGGEVKEMEKGERGM